MKITISITFELLDQFDCFIGNGSFLISLFIQVNSFVIPDICCSSLWIHERHYINCSFNVMGLQILNQFHCSNLRRYLITMTSCSNEYGLSLSSLEFDYRSAGFCKLNDLSYKCRFRNICLNPFIL